MNDITIVCIEGDKVNLCLCRTDDQAIEKYTVWFNDERINGWIGHNYKNDTIDDVAKLFRRTSTAFNYIYNIVEKENNQLIGICEIKYLPQARNATISLYIGEKEYRGRGYGKEVITLMNKYCFDELNAHRIGLTVYSDNLCAIRCYEKCGYIKCGVEHESDYHNGFYCDRIHMEIIKNT